MAPRKEEIREIMEVLKAAYREGQPFRIRPSWKDEVMAHVMRLDTLPSRADSMWVIPSVWRTAVAMGISALIVYLYSFGNHLGPDYEAARLFLEDPLGLVFAQPLLP
ncbi:MAG TPA: hypothetical protein VF790_08475 [Dissulfurispiraceae bacterium]